MKDMKEAKSWTLAELDEEISARKKEIEKLDAEVKKLREVKWQKLCEEMKPTLADSNIDSITLTDVQQLLQDKIEADFENKNSTQKKITRAKKKSTRNCGRKKSKVPAKNSNSKKTSPEKVAQNFSKLDSS